MANKVWIIGSNNLGLASSFSKRVYSSEEKARNAVEIAIDDFEDCWKCKFYTGLGADDFFSYYAEIHNPYSIIEVKIWAQEATID